MSVKSEYCSRKRYNNIKGFIKNYEMLHIANPDWVLPILNGSAYLDLDFLPEASVEEEYQMYFKYFWRKPENNLYF